MIRIVIENAVIFFTPAVLYVAWIAFVKRDWPGLGAVLRNAPLVKLFIAGAVLMLGTLFIIAFRETEGVTKAKDRPPITQPTFTPTPPNQPPAQ